MHIIKLEGGEARAISTAINKEKILNTPTSESKIKVDITGQGNSGLYFNYTGAETFNLKNYVLNATGDTAKNNALVYVQDGVVNLAAATDNKIGIIGGENNTAVYNAGTDILTTAATINISNSNGSTGISSVAGTVNNTGSITATGKSVKAIVAKGTTTITSTGKVTVNGTALSATDGSVGLASMNGGQVTQTNTDTSITVGGSASIGLYADRK